MCSDCLVIVRPYSDKDTMRILFAARTLLACEIGSRLLKRGTGATYFSMTDLAELAIPLDLSSHFKKLFKEYCSAAKQSQPDTLFELEEKVRSRIFEELIVS